MSRHQLPPRTATRRQQGFTLIELVAAFVIFALAFGILMSILTASLKATTQSADYTQAALWAQSLLDTQGIGERLQEGSSNGKFDADFRWQLNVAKYQPPTSVPAAGFTSVAGAGNGGQLINPVDLFELDLTVSWGGRWLTHNARFVTLRAANPDTGQDGNGAGGRAPAINPTRGARTQ